MLRRSLSNLCFSSSPLLRNASRASQVASASSKLSSSSLMAHKALLARRLEEKKEKLNSLELQRLAIDSEAYGKTKGYAYVGAAYLLMQTSTLFVWTYSTFDWNLVEPITYLLGYGVVWLSVLLYFCTGKDFTYSEVRELVAERARQRLYAKKGFDIESYRKVAVEVSTLQLALDGLKTVELRGKQM